MTALALASGVSLLLLLAGERLLLLRARGRLRHVIHVNGTRGKSTTARLIGAGLAAGGLRVVTKTTGTEARWIDIDGTERPVRRLGPASIREQGRLLLRAALRRADALVVECMAVAPELQRASERVLRADIAVITNVRADHEEVLGSDLAGIARSLCAMLPRGGALVTAEQALLPEIRGHADRAGCSVTAVASAEPERLGDFPANEAIAVEVCRLCGVEPEIARRGFARHNPDPGALRVVRWTTGAGAEIAVLNALAVNDAASLAPVLRSFFAAQPRGTRRILLLAARADRPLRTVQLARLAASLETDEVWVNPAGLVAARRALSRPRLVRGPATLDALAVPAAVAAIGNTHGFGAAVRRRLAEAARG